MKKIAVAIFVATLFLLIVLLIAAPSNGNGASSEPASGAALTSEENLILFTFWKVLDIKRERIDGLENLIKRRPKEQICEDWLAVLEKHRRSVEESIVLLQKFAKKGGFTFQEVEREIFKYFPQDIEEELNRIEAALK